VSDRQRLKPAGLLADGTLQGEFFFSAFLTLAAGVFTLPVQPLHEGIESGLDLGALKRVLPSLLVVDLARIYRHLRGLDARVGLLGPECEIGRTMPPAKLRMGARLEVARFV
jgi:hypothetical protein